MRSTDYVKSNPPSTVPQYSVLSLISDNNRIYRNMFTMLCGGTLMPYIQHPVDPVYRGPRLCPRRGSDRGRFGQGEGGVGPGEVLSGEFSAVHVKCFCNAYVKYH